MAALTSVLSIVWSMVFTPFLLFILCVIFLASIGKSLGVRKLYVNILLKLFEYGRQHIEVAKQLKRVESCEDKGGGKDDREEGKQQSDGGVVIHRENLLAPARGLECSARPSVNHSNCNGNSSKIVDLHSSSTCLINDANIVDHHDVTDGKNGIDANGIATPSEESFPTTPASVDFNLTTCLDYIKAGVESIIEDQVTSVFLAEELRSWNLLTRTNRQYEFISWRLTVIWAMGFLVRYCFLLPLRILICFIGILWIIVSMGIIGQFPSSRLKEFLSDICYKISFRIFARSLSCHLTFHNVHNKPKGSGSCVANHTSPIDVIMLSSENRFSLVLTLTACTAAVGCLPQGSRRRALNQRLSAACFALLSRSLSAVITCHGQAPTGSGICVANHTSPIDVLVLMCDNCYSLIGQRHGGFLGLLQRALARASPHIWFERSEVKDRNAVTNRLKEHVSDPNNPPILIFPEGTCINNTSVMQFKKGSFEVGGVIYPVAIKYDPKFGDAFWNSSQYSMMQYLYMMMTSWAIVCDVWYLPPMQRKSNETSVDFANRVKSVIAKQGGLVDLDWDGQLKRMKAKKEWKELQQEEFSRRIKGE